MNKGGSFVLPYFSQLTNVDINYIMQWLQKNSHEEIYKQIFSHQDARNKTLFTYIADAYLLKKRASYFNLDYSEEQEMLINLIAEAKEIKTLSFSDADQSTEIEIKRAALEVQNQRQIETLRALRSLVKLTEGHEPWGETPYTVQIQEQSGHTREVELPLLPGDVIKNIFSFFSDTGGLTYDNAVEKLARFGLFPKPQSTITQGDEPINDNQGHEHRDEKRKPGEEAEGNLHHKRIKK